eukprot:jgi/Ulvmu1/6033/UM027_0009.1
MRGDIHPDMTAATLSFTAQATQPHLRRPKSVGRISSKMFRLGSHGDLSPLASPPTSLGAQPCDTASSSPRLSALSTVTTASLAADVVSPQHALQHLPAGSGSGLAHVASGGCAEQSSRAGGAASPPSLLMKSLPGSPSAGSLLNMHDRQSRGSRRWQLLRRYVCVLEGESQLRREMWRAVARGLHSQAGMAHGGQSEGDSGMTQSSSAVSLQLCGNADLDESVGPSVDAAGTESGQTSLSQWTGVQRETVRVL